MTEITINWALYLSCFTFACFIAFNIMYITIKESRKKRKFLIINYVIKQADEWIKNYTFDKVFEIKDLFSPIKMNNAGIGNDASDLLIKNYSTNTHWFFKI